MEACSKHGDTVLKAINKCGDEYAELIARCVSHKKFANGVATQFLNAMTDHSDSMIKAIKACGVENYDTIADYSKIFGKFGDKAVGIVDNCLVKKFIGLDEALNAEHGKMVCFTMQDDLCIATVSGIEFYNPTITSFDNYIDPKFINRTDDAAKDYFLKQYDSMFTQQYVDDLKNNHRFSDIEKVNQSIANEYQKLIEAIENTRKIADKYIDPLNKPSFTNYPVTNCAEVWGAREMILKGYKFDDIKKHFLAFQLKDGLIREACENCKHTFDLLN